MLRFLAQTALTIIGNAAGIIVATLVLPDFRITGFGFFLSVLLFSVAQIILAPFVIKMAIKYAPALRGGIALVTTFLALLLTSTFSDGLRISGFSTWVSAPLIIWVVTVIASIVLPILLFKKVLGRHVV